MAGHRKRRRSHSLSTRKRSRKHRSHRDALPSYAHAYAGRDFPLDHAGHVRGGKKGARRKKRHSGFFRDASMTMARDSRSRKRPKKRKAAKRPRRKLLADVYLEAAPMRRRKRRSSKRSRDAYAAPARDRRRPRKHRASKRRSSSSRRRSHRASF